MVSPGAGTAPSANHISGIDRFRCFETARPDVFKRKRRMVKRALGDLPARVADFSVDLDAPNVEVEFIKSGYDNTSRTLLNWECAFAQPASDPRDAVLRLLAGLPSEANWFFHMP